jgi:hypothetical protein
VTKRILAALLAAFGLSAPAAAQAPSVVDQLGQAVRVFLGGQTESSGYVENYREHVMAGLDGRWAFVPLGDIDAQLLAKICERMAFEIVDKSAYGWTMHRTDPKGRDVTFRYASMGGGMFGEQVDPEQHLRWLGLDDERMPDGARASALASVNGVAAIFRPSPDILVIQTNYRAPRIFARCP